MTPPLIDDRGYVLGQVNIIDALAVQFGTAVAATGVAFIASDRARPGPRASSPPTSRPCTASRAPEPTALGETPDETEGECEPADAETGVSVVTVEVPDRHEVVVRPRSARRADGGDE